MSKMKGFDLIVIVGWPLTCAHVWESGMGHKSIHTRPQSDVT